MKAINTPSFSILTLAFIVFLAFVNSGISAQELNDNKVASSISHFKIHEKGKWFVTWGYNRSWYENSDIHFTGQGHDFILYNVVAKDRPSPLNLDYVNPTTWSTPQFNFRIGLFLSDKYSVSIGWDHMKYVALNYQKLQMYGHLDPSKVPDPIMKTNMETTNATYAPNGLYNYAEVIMDPETFLSYEHTDGFNYATVDLERYNKLWQSAKFNKLAVTIVTGVGAGIIVPRTDACLFGSGRNHFWNIAGWGANAKIGLELNIFKNIYLQSDLKCGYVQMNDVHTSNHYNIDKAQQSIVFYENSWLLGFRF